jgi:hypothetical protein
MLHPKNGMLSQKPPLTTDTRQVRSLTRTSWGLFRAMNPVLGDFFFFCPSMATFQNVLVTIFF